MVFSTKVLLSKTNVMQKKKNSSPAEKAKLWHVKGTRVFFFLSRKWAVAVPIFTPFNFFPLQTYFYTKSHLLSTLKPKKSDR